MNKNIELLLNRKTCRNFSEKEISKNDLDILLKAFNSAPSSAFRWMYSVVYVTDKNKIKHLMEISGQKGFTTMPPVLAFVVADYYRSTKIIEWNNQIDNWHNNEKLLTTTVDATLAGHNLVIAAHYLGIATTIIGGIKIAIPQIINELKLPKNTWPLFAIAIGYPKNDTDLLHGTNRSPVRLPLNVIAFENEYNHNSFTKEVLEQVDKKHLELNDNKFKWSGTTIRFNQVENLPNTSEQQKKQGF